MTNIVADEVLGKFARQQNDWFRRVREGSLNPEEVGRAVQNVIDRGHSFAYDKREIGWKLIEDVRFTPIDLNKLELVPFFKDGENSVAGQEMVRRSREELHTNLGQRHAEFLLEHQAEIPEEFRKYCIVFTGTIWLYPNGGHRVAYLYWDDLRWALCFRWLGGVCRSENRLPRLRE